MHTDGSRLRSRRLSPWISGPVIAGSFIALLWMEWRRPLRRERESKAVRDVRNLTVAAIAALSLRITEQPVVNALLPLVERRRWGLLQRVRLPLWAEAAAGIVLFDYTLYLWHVLTHRVPWLWRFHAVHHVDLDLDASTAIRFHFGELSQSAAWRALQVVSIGPSAFTISMWQLFVFINILFHHSNVRMPERAERILNLFFVTPRMHGIHHSAVEQETNSNWSSGLSVWDRLHRTLRLDVPQEEITIGVPAWSRPENVTLPRVLALPFEKQPDYWRPAF